MKISSLKELRVDFGWWVKKHREALHITQNVASKIAGINRQQWYRIETGKSGTKRETVIKMAKALKVDPFEALERAGYSPGKDSKEVSGSVITIGFPDSVRVTMQRERPFTESERNQFEIALRVAVEQAKVVIELDSSLLRK